MNASKGAAMKRLVLAVSAACLAVVAIVAASAILNEPSGAESGGPVPKVSRDDRIAVTSPLAPEVDSVIDLSTGSMKPLPDSIIRTVGKLVRGATVPAVAGTPPAPGSFLTVRGVARWIPARLRRARRRRAPTDLHRRHRRQRGAPADARSERCDFPRLVARQQHDRLRRVRAPRVRGPLRARCRHRQVHPAS